MLDTLIAGLYILVSPLGLVLMVVAAGLVLLRLDRRRLGEWILVGALGMLLVFSSEPLARLLLVPLESRYPPLEDTEDLEDVDWVVVLGSHASSDSNRPATTRLSGVAALRLIEGIRLHRSLPGTRLILSGGTAFAGTPSATVMSRAAVDLGADPGRLIVHPGPRNTHEEMVRLREALGSESFILVTSASHMPRAMSLAHARGLNPVAAPTVWRTRNQDGDPRRFLPSSTGLAMSERALHEYAGLIWAGLRGQLSGDDGQ